MDGKNSIPLKKSVLIHKKYTFENGVGCLPTLPLGSLSVAGPPHFFPGKFFAGMTYF